METKQSVQNFGREVVRYASFKEAYAGLKRQRDIDRKHPFIKCLLAVLKEAADKEADGVKVDVGTVFPEACRRFEGLAEKSAVKIGGDLSDE